MKKLILFGLMLISISMVYGIEEGDNYTQEQVDGVNYNNIDLHCVYHGYNVVFRWLFPYEVHYQLSCLDIQDRLNENGTVMDGGYTVYRKYFFMPVKFMTLYECVREYNVNICRTRLENMIQGGLIAEKGYIREGIWKRQTPPFNVSEFNFNITLNMSIG